MTKHVKGTLFLDYVRMIKSRKDVDWDKYLTPADRELMKGMILPSQWYPLDSYQRMGLAVLREIAGGKMELVRLWGRLSVDELCKTYKNMVHEGEPLETMKTFQALRRRLLDFEGLAAEVKGPNRVQITVDVPFDDKFGDEAAAFQMMGSFERLLELSGIKNIKSQFVAKAWEGAPRTLIELSWE
jgi:hypothetical protein